MAKYRKKAVVIDAVQINHVDCNLILPFDKAFDGPPFSEMPGWLVDAIAEGAIWPHNRGGTDYAQWTIANEHGLVEARPGDWIIKGVKGELYPCNPDVFEKTYEPG